MCLLPQVNEGFSFFKFFLDMLLLVDKMSTCFSFVGINRCEFDTAI